MGGPEYHQMVCERKHIDVKHPRFKQIVDKEIITVLPIFSVNIRDDMFLKSHGLQPFQIVIDNTKIFDATLARARKVQSEYH